MSERRTRLQRDRSRSPYKRRYPRKPLHPTGGKSLEEVDREQNPWAYNHGAVQQDDGVDSFVVPKHENLPKYWEISRAKVERLTKLSPHQLQKNIDSAKSWVKTFKGRNDMLKLRTGDIEQGIIVEWLLKEILVVPLTSSCCGKQHDLEKSREDLKVEAFVDSGRNLFNACCLMLDLEQG